MQIGTFEDSTKAVGKRIAASRATGKLDLSNCALSTVPRAVWDPAVELQDDETPWWSVEVLKVAVFHHNQLSTIPPELCCLADLQVLNLASNHITGLPEDLSALKDLRSLVLSKNRLQTLPEAVAELPALARLDCCGNPRLSALPCALGAAQPALAAVIAEDCSLRSVPEGLARGRGLRSLSLAGNALTGLPEGSIAEAASLTSLDLRCNRLATLPDHLLLPCSQLVSLSLANNRLTALPVGVCACATLASLDVSHNRLRTLPDALRACTALAELSAHDNRLTSLGAGVPALPVLRLLDIRNNDLVALPLALGHATTLRAIPLSGNPMRSIPRVVRDGPISRLLEHLRMQEDTGSCDDTGGATAQRGAAAAIAWDTSATDLARRTATQLSLQSKAEAQAREEGACVFVHGPGGSMHERRSGGASGGGAGKVIDVSGLGLKELPAEVFEVGPVASSLLASRNALPHVSADALAALCNITALDLSRNTLQTWPLPMSTGSLSELQALDVSGNRQLPALPAAALSCCAVTLTHLDLSGCSGAAHELSPVAACSVLKALHLDTCGLSMFPSFVQHLPCLAILSLESNAISEIPVAPVAALEALEELNVRNNSLMALPPQLSLLPRLRSLQVDGNMLRTLRRSVLNRGTPALLEYLRSRLPPQ